jgi:hypothetical protein
MSDHNAEIVKKWDDLKARKFNKSDRITALAGEFGMTKKALSEVLKSEGVWHDRSRKKSKLEDVKERAKKASAVKKQVYDLPHFQLSQNIPDEKSNDVQDILSLIIWSFLIIFTIFSLIAKFFN